MAENIDNRIKDLLNERNMTQKQLSEATGVTESAISHYVNGDRIPRGENLIKIANALGMSTDDFLGNKQIIDKESDLNYARVLLARNAAEMTPEERLSFIQLLSSQGKNNDIG